MASGKLNEKFSKKFGNLYKLYYICSAKLNFWWGTFTPTKMQEEENLLDHMTNEELVLNILVELSTTIIARFEYETLILSEVKTIGRELYTILNRKSYGRTILFDKRY